MSVFQEALKEATMFSLLVMALPGMCCVFVIVRAIIKEVKAKWYGKRY